MIAVVTFSTRQTQLQAFCVISRGALRAGDRGGHPEGCCEKGGHPPAVYLPHASQQTSQSLARGCESFVLCQPVSPSAPLSSPLPLSCVSLSVLLLLYLLLFLCPVSAWQSCCSFVFFSSLSCVSLSVLLLLYLLHFLCPVSACQSFCSFIFSSSFVLCQPVSPSAPLSSPLPLSCVSLSVLLLLYLLLFLCPVSACQSFCSFIFSSSFVLCQPVSPSAPLSSPLPLSCVSLAVLLLLCFLLLFVLCQPVSPSAPLSSPLPLSCVSLSVLLLLYLLHFLCPVSACQSFCSFIFSTSFVLCQPVSPSAPLSSPLPLSCVSLSVLLLLYLLHFLCPVSAWQSFCSFIFSTSFVLCQPVSPSAPLSSPLPLSCVSLSVLLLLLYLLLLFLFSFLFFSVFFFSFCSFFVLLLFLLHSLLLLLSRLLCLIFVFICFFFIFLCTLLFKIHFFVYLCFVILFFVSFILYSLYLFSTIS